MADLDHALWQMDAAGIPRPEHLVYGKLIRYGRPKKKYWYVFHEFRARNGRYYVSGAFGRWEGEQNIKYKIESDFKGIDEDERERLQRSMAAQAEAEAARRTARALDAAKRARAQWKQALPEAPRALPDPLHGPVRNYLDRKGVTPERVRFFADGTVLVRMLDFSGDRPKIKGLQKIAPDGAKLFNKHMEKSGTLLPLGNVRESDRIALLCEGYATARSIRMALALDGDDSTCVFVAFDAGNLMPAARVLRQQFPDLHILICADDDAYIESRVNKRLAGEFGVVFSEAQRLYKVGYDGRRRFIGKAGPVEIEATWAQDDAGVDSAIGALSFEDRTHPFAMTNAGLVKANECAQWLGNASVVQPRFTRRELSLLPDCPRLTDFNDLHQSEGLAAVKVIIESAILAALARMRAEGRAPPEAAGGDAPPEAAGGDAPPPPGEDAAGTAKPKRPKKPRAASPPSGEGGDDDGEPPEDARRHLYSPFHRGRFSYIYPTDTVFDHDEAQVVRLGALRNAYTKGVVNWWLAQKWRRTVNIRDVVFDPLSKADPSTTCNLFRGLTAKPDAAPGCERLLDLLYYLCGESREDTHTPITDWVLRWMAYPLQHVGAKMATAVVMYGDEGTGKNIIWGALKDIYGRYGGIIGQNQLNSQFNTWLTAKLFLTANEVVTAQERSHYVGYLKNLVTEDKIHVEAKGVDSREEANHCQFVFLSNELQPLKIDPRDRRFMVIRTPAPRGEAYYQAVVDEVRNNGAMALYDYLLKLDLQGFHPHTKPLGTDGREAVIELSMTSAQLYWRDLHDGLLPMPYAPGLVTDYYDGFRAWCDRNGERMPARLNTFSAQFMSMNGVTRTKPLRVRDPDALDEASMPASDLPQRKVFLVGEEKPPAEGQRAWLDAHIKTWRDALKSYKGRGRSSGRQGDGDEHEPF